MAEKKKTGSTFQQLQFIIVLFIPIFYSMKNINDASHSTSDTQYLIRNVRIHVWPTIERAAFSNHTQSKFSGEHPYDTAVAIVDQSVWNYSLSTHIGSALHLSLFAWLKLSLAFNRRESNIFFSRITSTLHLSVE